MTLHFIESGLQTCVQDEGRPGMMHWGVPRGGAADPLAMALANLLLRNAPGHPCIEIALSGPVIEFSVDISVAVCGARFDLRLNGEPVANDEVIQVRRGDRLSFGAVQSGARAYLALAAEMDLPPIYGSRSTHLIARFGGLSGRAIKAGDRISLGHCRLEPYRALPGDYRINYRTRPLLRVVAGAEARYFEAAAIRAFYGGGFTVSPQSNRMGIRLTGEPLTVAGMPQMISSGLCPGTVQVPPNGLPIVSFVEGQTIGGYPRIAHVISADLHRLAQLAPNARLDFELVSQHRAHRILREKARLLAALGDQW